jgi:hypothetical protein
VSATRRHCSSLTGTLCDHSLISENRLDSIITKAKQGSMMFYIGYTKRLLRFEDLRWLTARGANQMHLSKGLATGSSSSRRNRPVLTWKNGDNITESQARGRLGFTSFVVQRPFAVASQLIAC